jgi:hypothetical protein
MKLKMNEQNSFSQIQARSQYMNTTHIIFLLYYLYSNNTSFHVSKTKYDKYAADILSETKTKLTFSEIRSVYKQTNLLITLQRGNVQFLAYDFDSKSIWEQIKKMASNNEFGPCILNESPRGGHLLFPNIEPLNFHRIQKFSPFLGVECEAMTAGTLVLLGPEGRDITLVGIDIPDSFQVEQLENPENEIISLMSSFIEKMKVPSFLLPTPHSFPPLITGKDPILEEGIRNSSIFTWMLKTKAPPEVAHLLSQYFCLPPLPESEINSIIKSAKKMIEKGEYRSNTFDTSELEDARFLAGKLKGKFIYHNELQTWFVFVDTHWKPVSRFHVEKYLYQNLPTYE